MRASSPIGSTPFPARVLPVLAAVLAAVLGVLAPVGAGADAQEPRRVVPYRGPLPPPDPPMRMVPGQQPLAPAVIAALNVLYERPSPLGPPPIPLPAPRAIWFEGRSPVIQVLPGPMPYIEHVPEGVRTALPAKGPYSNHVIELEEGTARVVAYDRTLNDTKLSEDSMAVEIEFTDRNGDRWVIEQAALAPLSPDPVNEPWLGGLVIDTIYHGESGQGIAAEPWLRCALCSWGWVDVWKNDAKVQSGVLMHVMLSSDVRADASEGYEYACYDCRDRPIREVHVIIPPEAGLPFPGGFLHLMWENAEVRRGTPVQIAAQAPELADDWPTITLRAVPYLQWSDTTIHVRAGQRYRLLLQNDDPSAAHAMHAHLSASGGHHGEGAEAATHATRGRGEFTRGTPGEEELPSAAHEIKVPLPHGSLWATTIEFSEPGEYHFYCPVENHHARGMMGKFIVEPPDQGGDR